MFHVKARNFLDFLLPVVLSSFAISLVAGVIGSLFFPKPIAGGLYRIEMDLQQVIDDNDLRVQTKLRDGDQLIPLAEQINLLLNDMRTRMNHVQLALTELEKIDQQEVSTETLQRIRDHLILGHQNLKI
jgi:methyl-accepting chemotaxis protein